MKIHTIVNTTKGDAERQKLPSNLAIRSTKNLVAGSILHTVGGTRQSLQMCTQGQDGRSNSIAAETTIRKFSSVIPPIEQWPAIDILKKVFGRLEGVLRTKQMNNEDIAFTIVDYVLREKNLYALIAFDFNGLFGEHSRDESVKNEILESARTITANGTSKMIRGLGGGASSFIYIRRGAGFEVGGVYRVYLAVNQNHIGKILNALDQGIPSGINFDMKTLNPRPDPCYGDWERIDSIVVYCSPKDLTIVWDAIKKIHASNRDAFTGQPEPGGGFSVGLEGVSVNYDRPEHVSQTSGTELIEEKLNDIFLPTINQRGRQWMRNFLFRPDTTFKEKMPAWKIMQLLMKKYKGKIVAFGSKNLRLSPRTEAMFWHIFFNSLRQSIVENKSLQECEGSIIGYIASAHGDTFSSLRMGASGYLLPQMEQDFYNMLGLTVILKESLANGTSLSDAMSRLLTKK